MIATLLRRRRWLIVVTLAAVVFPFVVSILVDGAGPGAVLSNQDGNAKFLEGLAIEIFILALYAISYDLVLGVAGLLSFGHAMFFAVGAYTIGIMLRSFDMAFLPALGVVLIAAILQAVLFAIVLPRVKGITFALVTLGLASAFAIIIQSTELADYAGAEIGLQGVISPAWLDTTTERFRFYLVALTILVIVYVVYTRLVDSPTGKVLAGIRENEDRASMLGYNTFWFKLTALLVASITAAFAGVLHTLHQPIVTPNIAGLGWTVTALLVILIGGVGTVSGAVVGAVVFRLLQFYLDRWFGGASNILIGLAYIALVLYLPFGIVGTWRARSLQIAAGRRRLLSRLTGRHPAAGGGGS
ncbi:MAG: branched-chain amino acid ABC transporter permease [Actinobacteria bacterium]|nr:branched-chain amino acid ABC transporter permease [Actinomycetota bacterium]